MPSQARGGRPATKRARPRTRSSPARSSRGGAPAQERELRAQGRQTMRRLLEAGSYVFEQRGFSAARVDDIVRVAKTSHGTFYLYFSNKEDLFKALAHDALSEMASLADELPPVTADAAGYEILRGWVGRFVDTYNAHGTVIRSWTERALDDHELIAEGSKMLVRLSATLAGRIAEAGLGPRESQAAGVACLAMLERFTYFAQAHQVEFDRDEIVDTLTGAAFAGFFSPRPGKRRPGKSARG